MCPPPSLQGASTLQQQGSDASAHTDNGDDDDAGQDDGGRARELYGDGNEVSARSSERTGCEGARPSAVPVCLRPCRDDALSDAVQVVAAWATAREAAAVAVPAMWPGAAMSRGLGVWQRRLLAALEERPTVSLVDGVHFEPIDCLIRFGKRWRGDASEPLVAFGLEPPRLDGGQL